MHRFLLHNGEIQDTRAQTLSPGQVGLLNGWGVFSTLRVTDKVMFAFERHWRRMRTDAARLRVPFPEEAAPVYADLRRLIEANGAENATMRIVVVRNTGGAFEAPGLNRPFDVIGFTRDLTDWSTSVRLGIKPHGRYAQSEFTGAKMLSWAQNLRWYEEARERGLDEFVLLNERGEVSECTSANIFVVEGSNVFTPPLEAGCLPGVTRELLLEEIRVEGINVSEKTLFPEDLEHADSVWITSSTRDLLPVSAIELAKIRHCGGGPVEELLVAFRRYREHYMRERTCEVGSQVLPV